ncbi:MAG: hypothetical protein LBS12_01630 [Prevotellaceae bacterium]|nr:hypothetical protein [Prevotellaceae bacterium]
MYGFKTRIPESITRLPESVKRAGLPGIRAVSLPGHTSEGISLLHNS